MKLRDLVIGFCSLFFFFLCNKIHAQDKVELPSKAEQKNIRLLARVMVESYLRGLLNTIAFEDVEKDSLKSIMMDSYLPSKKNQVFYDDGAIIEDDITPSNTATAQGSDKMVATYLSNLDIFYKKSERETIFFSDVSVSDVKANNYLYLKVYFKSEFRGEYNTNEKNKNKPNQNYRPVLRVAELRAEKDINNQWKVYITHIGYYKQSPDDSNGNITPEERRRKAIRDSVEAVELKQAYQNKIEELLTQGQIILNTTNDKNSAAEVFRLACYFRDSYKLDSPKFEELYKEYMNKGDIIFDAEIYDNAAQWYALAQSIKDSAEVSDKIKVCKKK